MVSSPARLAQPEASPQGETADGARIIAPAARPATDWSLFTVGVLAAGWGAGFGWLALQRHLAGGTHAEDLGFTEQVIANFSRGQWFRQSIYQGATWNTEFDLGHLARPDSLLAFHVEPMLLLLVPLYAVGGISLLLVLQALAVAAGVLPAYRLARHGSGSAVAGVAVVLAYLLSPLGQWAVLDDFHTSTLAAPLLLLGMERLMIKRSNPQAFLAFGLAALAREDVGLPLAALGGVLLLRRRTRNRAALALLVMGLAASLVGAAIIRSYFGGALPYDARYAETLGRGLGTSLAALTRPGVLGYMQTLLLSGAWLGLLSPLALVPALPILTLNAFSTSPWMAAGKAHYSSLVLPFVVLGAVAALAQLQSRIRLRHALSAVLVLGSVVGYVHEGSGPFAGNFAPAIVTEHAVRAESLARALPADAAVSASAALVPRLSQRAHVYVFPALLDAEYVFVDLKTSPAPTSAGDVFLRTQTLLASGTWHLQTAEDGLLLLQRQTENSTEASALAFQHAADTLVADSPPPGSDEARVSLLSAQLVPSPDGAVDVDGPRWILRTTWRAEQPLPPRSRMEFWLTLRDGRQWHVWDIASLWWNPPARWPTGEPVTIDVPDVPIRQFVSWRAAFSDAQP